jgi:integrase
VGGKKELHLGVYPAIPLKRARELAQEAREAVARGEDPRALKKAAKVERSLEAVQTFEALGREWLKAKTPSWSESHAKGQARRFEKDLLPFLGKRPVKELKASDLVRALRALEERSGAWTAKRVRPLVHGIFRHAMSLGVLDADPTTTIHEATEAPPESHFAAPTDPAKVGSILRALDSADLAGVIVQAALRLHPLVVVRPGELRHARWADFDFEAREWIFIPPKTKKKKPEPHVVPLSRQALAILEGLKPYTGAAGWVFPSPRAMTQPLSNGALGAALARIGIPKTELVPHGWRAVFRTLGAERCGFQWDCLEAQLAHAVPDVLGRSYNRAEWMEQRRAMMQQWADYLDELKGLVFYFLYITDNRIFCIMTSFSNEELGKDGLARQHRLERKPQNLNGDKIQLPVCFAHSHQHKWHSDSLMQKSVDVFRCPARVNLHLRITSQFYYHLFR